MRIDVNFNEISSLINLDGNMREEEDHIMTIRDIDFSARCIKTTADIDDAIRALQELKPKIERGCTRNTIQPILDELKKMVREEIEVREKEITDTIAQSLSHRHQTVHE